MNGVLSIALGLSIMVLATNEPSLKPSDLVSENITQNTTLTVKGMVCAFCAKGIETSVRELNSVKDVVIDLDEKIVVVKSSLTISDDVFHSIIMDAGYSIESIHRSTEDMIEIHND